MAKLKYGILGPISGKLGPVVGGTWNGISYLRMRPKKTTAKIPKTEAQIANEMKFKYMNDWLVPFHPYVSVGFKPHAIGRTAISAAFSVNYHQAVNGVYPDLSIDYSKVVISAGNLPGLNEPKVILSAPDVLELSWLQNNDAKASFDDQVMLVAYSPELKIASGFIGLTSRKDKFCGFKFNPGLIGAALEVYLGVTSLSRRIVADSVYLGRMEPYAGVL